MNWMPIERKFRDVSEILRGCQVYVSLTTRSKEI